jgi:hypothetical protein
MDDALKNIHQPLPTRGKAHHMTERQIGTKPRNDAHTRVESGGLVDWWDIGSTTEGKEDTTAGDPIPVRSTTPIVPGPSGEFTEVRHNFKALREDSCGAPPDSNPTTRYPDVLLTSLTVKNAPVAHISGSAGTIDPHQADHEYRCVDTRRWLQWHHGEIRPLDAWPGNENDALLKKSPQL